MKGRAAMLLVLVGLCMVSAVAVVQAKHRARGLQQRLQVLRVQRDHLKTQWAQLQLEQSAWGNPDRVARIARNRLDMHRPHDYTVLGEQP